jgi:hypothetical protein
MVVEGAKALDANVTLLCPAVHGHRLVRERRGNSSFHATSAHERETPLIRKLKSGQYRLYSRKKNPKTGKRRNLGTFKSLAAAKKHERAVQFFKRH